MEPDNDVDLMKLDTLIEEKYHSNKNIITTALLSILNI